MFASSATQGAQGGLFGSSTAGQNQQFGGSGLFGSMGQNTQQNQTQGTGLFGNIGHNAQNQQQAGTSTFGQSAQQQNQPQQGTSLFTGLGQSTQQPQQNASLFGGLGQSTQQPQQPSGFGLQQQQQQQQQGLGQSQQNQFSNSLWQPNSGVNTREKSIVDQLSNIHSQWDPANSNCAFQHYFYNKIPNSSIEHFRPGPNEDPKKWEDALKAKPGPGYVPVLCTGFSQLAERLDSQARNLAIFNAELHATNAKLEELLHQHETITSIRAMDAKRKHVVLKRRCLVLATKVQILRNRGYAMGADEEDLKAKLVTLEKGVNDPGLDARQEEIWARMLSVQEQARQLKSEIERSGQPVGTILDEQANKRAQKILEDYQIQLNHLKNELDSIQKDYVEWEKEQMPTPIGR